MDLFLLRSRRRRQDPEPAARGSVLRRHPRVRQYHDRDRRPGHPEGHRHPAEQLQRHLVPAAGRPEQLGDDCLQPGRLITASPVQPVTGGGILEGMKPARAASRRYLPTSPFGPPSAPPPAEQYALQDQVTHDTYGLGQVIGIDVDSALVVNFGTRRVRITTPYTRLTKL